MIVLTYSHPKSIVSFRKWLMYQWPLQYSSTGLRMKPVKDEVLTPRSYVRMDHESINWARGFRILGIEICVLITEERIYEDKDTERDPQTC